MTRGRESAHGAPIGDTPRSASSPAEGKADRDELNDASRDSFPASDPPAFMGMRVGGPPRENDGASSSAHNLANVLPVHARTTLEPDCGWLERVWPQVQVRHAEVRPNHEPESAELETLRAVVQLGGLTPADVVVTAQRVSSPAERTQSETLRLWSVQSHHNGEVVFEAAATKQHDVDRMSYLLVTVEPAASAPGERTLAVVERLVETHVVAGDSPR